MKSILQEDKECFVCRTTQNLEDHHIFFGSNRKVSEKHGFKVWLCNYHHTGSNKSVHRDHEVDLTLKRICQKKYMEKHSEEEFIELIGKSYL